MSTSAPIAAILLAGGAGSRFGGGKLLHPLADGVAIGAHAARNLYASGLGVIAVVPAGDFPLADLLEQEGCEVTMCARTGRGMGASLAHGVEHTRSAGGWIIALADMPAIRPETIRRIAAALEAGAVIVAPVYQGTRGHPVAFAAKLRDELIALDGDSGARTVLERHRESVTLLETDDPGVLYDVDRKSDLDRAV